MTAPAIDRPVNGQQPRQRNSRIRSRKPTGAVAHPIVLLAGPEGTGKSWAALALSASPRVGACYVIDLGEGTSDEYGGIPGADFELITHDGTYHDIADQIDAVHEEATRAHQAGDPPVVLVVDSMTHLWGMLKDWTTQRAARTRANQKKLRENPDSEIDVSQNFWNDANGRHKKIVTRFLTFPGIVVLTARAGEVSEVDRDGKPTGEKIWRVEANKNLPFDASLIVRMELGQHPVITKARSIHAPVHPQERPKPVPDFSLDRVIFDVLRYDPAGAAAIDVTELSAGDLTDEERRVEGEQARDQRPAEPQSQRPRGNGGRQQAQPEPPAQAEPAQADIDWDWVDSIDARIDGCTTVDAAKALWKEVAQGGKEGRIDTATGTRLQELITEQAAKIRAAEQQPAAEDEGPVNDDDAPATEAQLQQAAIALGKLGYSNDREQRNRYVGSLLGLQINTMKDLTRAQADDLNAKLNPNTETQHDDDQEGGTE